MNILFDFLTVSVKTGAGEYHRRVFFELLKAIERDPKSDIRLFALFDSNKGIAYQDLKEDVISEKYNIQYVDCKEKGVDRIVEDYKIDLFFIACGHYLRDNKEISRLRCEVVCVIHDLYGEEKYNNKIYLYQDLLNPNYTKSSKEISYKWKILTRLPVIRKVIPHDLFSYYYVRWNGNERYGETLTHVMPAMQLVLNNDKARLITVSEYSKTSIHYYFNIPYNKIRVLYSPERNEVESQKIQNIDLQRLIDSKKKYYVMVSGDRVEKNPFKVIDSFERYSKDDKDAFLVTLSFPSKVFDNHITFPFLNDSDLQELLKHCYALIFPSFFEGFGYPPLEAMHYGKPVLCSNTSSLPEIFEDAPIYFTPFYEASIYQALEKLTDDNYDEYCRKSEMQYQKIHARQQSDLQKMIGMLIKNSDDID